MAKVTSKLQVTVPKAIAERFGIRPGDEIEWLAAGDGIRVLAPRVRRPRPQIEERLRLFDRATERQRRREAARRLRGRGKPAQSRGWNREDLYPAGRGGAG